MARQSIYCDICRREKLHERQDVNHVLHLLLCLFCCPAWPVIWFASIFFNTWFEPWLCMDCGNAVPSDKTVFYVALGMFAGFSLLAFSITLAIIILIAKHS